MRDRGFTLIELLIVAAIIGIIAALAIPNYFVFKSIAYNSMAASDARNVSPAAELLASRGGDTDIIPITPGGGPVEPTKLPGATTSPGTEGLISVWPNHYVIEVCHPGAGTEALTFSVDSDSGWTVTSGCS